MNGNQKRKLSLAILLMMAASLVLLSAARKKPRWKGIGKRRKPFYTEGKFNEAIIEYRNVIQIDPKHAQAYYKLGLSYLRVKMFREAFVSLNKSLELNPDNSDARIQIGTLFLLSRRQSEGPRSGGQDFAERPQ